MRPLASRNGFRSKICREKDEIYALEIIYIGISAAKLAGGAGENAFEEGNSIPKAEFLITAGRQSNHFDSIGVLFCLRTFFSSPQVSARRPETSRRSLTAGRLMAAGEGRMIFVRSAAGPAYRRKICRRFPAFSGSGCEPSYPEWYSPR